MNFKEEYTDRVEKIEKILKKYLPEKKGYQRTIMEAMEYSLMAGGKRLRPMLMWESYRLFGGEGAAIEPFMAAIEMIHTYSLVHDDLPAMDNDEYRRGRRQRILYTVKIWESLQETRCLIMHLRLPAGLLKRSRSML